MKALAMLVVVVGLFGCGGEEKGGGAGGKAAVTVDQSSPKGLAESIFAAARSGELAVLEGIAAPDADGDSKQVAGVAKADAKKQDEFKTYFATGKVNGEVTIEGARAAVPILFGPDGTKPETFNLVKIDGKWFLRSL